MSTRSSITTLRAEDYSTWLPLWQGYQRFYGIDIPDDVSATTFERFCDDSEPMSAWLAWDDTGTAVGLVHVVFHRSTWTQEDYCYLQDLFVDPQARRSGWATQLIATAKQAAQERHCSRIYWLTHHTNDGAIELYRRVADDTGFIQFRIALP